jgi:hypothetical protein
VNASSELLVYINDTVKTETTHYTVSLNADGTGSVTFTTATTSGELITVIGDQPLSRTTVFQVGQVNQPTTLETEFDNTLIRQQQIKEITDRSVQLKPSTGRIVTGSGTSGPLYFPYDTTVANNANRVLKYDSNGTSLELGSTTTNIDALAAIASDITTVSGISSNVTTVAGIASNVTSVASNASNINTVATNIANVNTVAGISSNVTTVAGISANVTTVAGISSDVSTVAGISANVTTVAGDTANIATVAGNTTNINTVATNITDVNTFANKYRIAATDPTTSLDVGDLYYDTTNDIMKVYGSSGWQNAGSSVNGTSARFQYSVSSSTTTITGTDDNGNSLLYDAGYVDVYLNGIKMVNGSDVTITSGTSVVFATAIGTSGTDTVDIIAYGTFNVAAIDATSITSGTLGYARGGTGLGALGSADEVLKVNAGGTALEYGKIGTDNLEDGSVTSAKIATGTIVTVDMADGSVTSLKIADGGIATADIADNAITGDKLADSVTIADSLTVTGTTSIAEAIEKVTIDNSTTGTINFDALTQAVMFFDTDQTANRTINFRGDASTTLDSIMSIGESMTFAVLMTEGTTAYYLNTYQVDGSAVTPEWSGGTAPSAGNASSIDSYSFTIIKTASATFTILAGQTQYA